MITGRRESCRGSYRALQAESDIGLLLPCNVVVRQEVGGRVTVAFVNPLMMMEMVSKPEVQDVAQDAEQRLRRACKSLQSEESRGQPKKPEKTSFIGPAMN